jgi:biotin synthase-related radical SAM superfamily protein
MQLLFGCRQKPSKNPMQKLPKKPTKIWNKNLLHGQKLLQSFNKILAKNFERYPKTS